MIPLGNHFFYEPQLQLGFASFDNKILKVVDEADEANDQSVRLTREYYAVGLINSICVVNDYKAVRLKYFLGFKLQERNYHDTRFEDIYYLHRIPYNPPEKSTYGKLVPGVHAGVELGLRFK